MRALLFRFALTLLCLSVSGVPARAQTEQTESAQTAWRLLDYIAVDYSGAVQNGRIISDTEYVEMLEFAGQVEMRIAGLPTNSAKPALTSAAKALRNEIGGKATSEEVAKHARALSVALLAAYPTTLAPSKVPDLERGAVIYRKQCSACHGLNGAGDGPDAATLNPPPIAFIDRDRARQRSIFGLYQVIHQGLDGTGMASYAHLSTTDQWALAFYVGRFAFTNKEARKGEKIWQQDAALQSRLPDLKALTQATPALLAKEIGDNNAMALTAYLRRHPEAVTQKPGAKTLNVAHTRLIDSLKAYEAGDYRRASDFALAAYLDGFEPIEPILSARDPALMRRIETAMGELRGSIQQKVSSADLRSQMENANALIDAAELSLSSQSATSSSSFVGAFTILLREGLEALLIIVAMIAFLRKAERKDVLAYVHGGWIAALGVGGLTWFAATYLISISGASRELTEGFGSLIAAVVLVTVGLWMHGKAQADVWQKYIRDKLSKALSRKSAWFLFLLAFIVVYREVFETILFFVALWNQGNGVAMLAGAGVAAILLGGIAWTLLSYSRRLPIAQFFSLSSMLMAVLAVVLTGKGVAALQEAGLIDIQPLHRVPSIQIIGLYPTVAGVVAQLTILTVMVAGFWYTARRRPLN